MKWEIRSGVIGISRFQLNYPLPDTHKFSILIRLLVGFEKRERGIKGVVPIKLIITHSVKSPQH